MNPSDQNKTINCNACYELIDACASVCPHCKTRQKQTHLMQVKEISKWIAGTLTVISLVLGVSTLNNLYSDWKAQQAVTDELLRSADRLINVNSYRQAWQLISQAQEMNPGSSRVQRAQAQLSMVWLRNMVLLKNEIYSQFVDPMVPILARELVQADSMQTANIKAHLGWIRFMQEKDRNLLHADKDTMQVVTQIFNQVLEEDPKNYWAHAMWAYIVMDTEVDVDNSVKYLDRALELVSQQQGKNSDEYVWIRNFQWRTLKLRLVGSRGTSDENEIKIRAHLLKIVNDMRVNQEAHPGKRNSRIVFDSYGRRLRGENVDALLKVLPAPEHMKTFKWLFNEKEYLSYVNKAFHYQYKYVYARLLEHNGSQDKALPIFAELSEINTYEELDIRIDSAIERISGVKTERAVAREARQYVDDEIPENADQWQFHADTLMNFQPDIVAENIQAALGYFNEPNRPEISAKQIKTYELLKDSKLRVKRWLDDKNTELKKSGYNSEYSKASEENAYDNYIKIWQLLGLYAFANNKLDEAIAQWSDLNKVANPVPPSLFIHLSKAYNKRADQTQITTDRKQALHYLSLYIEAKVKYGGALNFDHVKSDPVLVSLHSNKTYIQLMQGR